MDSLTLALMIGDEMLGPLPSASPIVVTPRFCKHGTHIPHWHTGNDTRSFCPECQAEWARRFQTEEVAAMWAYYARTRRLPIKLNNMLHEEHISLYPYQKAMLLR